ncbi:NlpC/P60 family protein [Anaerobacterium chartisolvens]|uniref:NlpC/P60 family protein n=1 Tax=Anaerobacterium chartisolvens TaxID=1297424 RepID=A0A369B9B2_9FIRM|nr:C40 family peptidase [Anaerobacterium chartisolvens]RCX17146.1 NlpC/P60 family protein [Anaerobacterium chartisolvens]
MKRNIRVKAAAIFYIALFLTGVIVSFLSEPSFPDDTNILRQEYLFEKNSGAAVKSSEMLYHTLIGQLGKPYAYGQEGPDSFDCSGLTKYVYSKIGLSLPRLVSEQAKAGEWVDKADLEFGDIVFFSNDSEKEPSHAGIYIGHSYFIHAPKTGDVVKVSSLSSEYYRQKYFTAARFL